MATLPRDRAFVVQLAADASTAPAAFAGRVEHVASGRAAHFQSIEEYLAFVASMLCTPGEDPEKG